MKASIFPQRLRQSNGAGADTLLGKEWRLASVVAIAAIVCIGLAARLAFGPHIRDDAYITLRYAQQVAAGKGFVFNPGQRVLGTTTPLYTLLLALLLTVGASTTLAAVGIGIAADMGVIVLLWQLGRRLTKREELGILAALIYAQLTPSIEHAVSGMETSLYLFVILLAFELLRQRRAVGCAFLCGLAAFVRPDGLMVGCVCGLYGFVDTLHPRPATWRAGLERVAAAAVLPGAAFSLSILPWVGYAWWYFGNPIPQSLLAKWSLLGVPWFASFRELPLYFLDVNERWFLPLTVLASIGLVSGLLRNREARPLLLWTALYTLAFMATNKLVYPLWPFEWYFIPLMPAYCLAVAAGAAWVWMRLVAGRRFRCQVATGAALVVVVGGLSIVNIRHARGLLDRDLAGRETLYGTLARRLSEYGAAFDTVAANEIGALGFAHPGPLIDLGGLVTPEAVHQTTEGILRKERPPWLVSYQPTPTSETTPTSLPASRWFQAHYRPVDVLFNWESRRLALYRWYDDPLGNQVPGPVAGGSLELAGRSARWDDTSTGRFLRVELAWRALSQEPPPTTFSVRLVDGEHNVLAHQDNPPQEGTSRTDAWRAGQLVSDRYDLRLPSTAATNPSWLEVVAYPTDDAAHPLTWRSAAGSEVGPALDLPLPVRAGQDAGLHACSAAFAGGIRLGGFQLASGGSARLLRLDWLANQLVPTDQTVFVHVLDQKGHLVGQADGPPDGGRLPTSMWRAGDRVVDERDFPIGALAPGDQVQVGLYAPSSGARLPRANTAGDSVTLSFAGEPSCS